MTGTNGSNPNGAHVAMPDVPSKMRALGERVNKMDAPSKLRFLEATIQRLQLASQLGMQFAGKRDLYSVFGYPTSLTFVENWNKYRRQDIARRVVNAPVKATWRGRPKIDGGETFNKAWNEFAVKTKLWRKIERLDRLVAMGNYAALLIGFNNGKPESAIAQGGGKEVLYLQPHPDHFASIGGFDENTASERYGLPISYNVQTTNLASLIKGGQPALDRASTTTTWHWTRVIHVAEDFTVDEVYGHSRMEAVYNLLEDLMKIAGGSAETFWLAGNRGLALNMDPEVELLPSDEQALADEVDEYTHQQRRILRLRGIEVKELGTSVVDPKGVFNVTISLISAATGIPQRVLLGAEAGQLASETDRANWAERVEERRTDFAEEAILRPLIDRLVWAGALPPPRAKDPNIVDGQVDITWDAAFRMSPIEAGNTMALRARAYNNVVGKATDPVISVEEARVMLGFPEKMPTGQQGLVPSDGGNAANPNDRGSQSSSSEPKTPTDRPNPPAPRN